LPLHGICDFYFSIDHSIVSLLKIEWFED